MFYNKSMERYLIIFKGQVQGVGFRYTASVIAKKYNLSGYAQNLYTSGDVRVEVQGQKENIDSFINEILNNQNRWIIVEDYSIKKIDIIKNEKNFGIRY